jgi:hypothetical protein
MCKLYPSISAAQIKIIRHWVKQHEEYLIAENKRATKNYSDKKRVLP